MHKDEIYFIFTTLSMTRGIPQNIDKEATVTIDTPDGLQTHVLPIQYFPLSVNEKNLTDVRNNLKASIDKFFDALEKDAFIRV